MYHAEVRDDGVVHVLPEERAVVKGIERYPIRSRGVSAKRCRKQKSFGLHIQLQKI